MRDGGAKCGREGERKNRIFKSRYSIREIADTESNERKRKSLR